MDGDDQLTYDEAEAFIESLDLDMNREQFNVRNILERIDQAKIGRVNFDQTKQGGGGGHEMRIVRSLNLKDHQRGATSTPLMPGVVPASRRMVGKESILSHHRTPHPTRALNPYFQPPTPGHHLPPPHPLTHPCAEPPTSNPQPQVITCRAFNTIQSGRYYVVLSLVEAEALRGVLHLRQDKMLVDEAQVKASGVRLRLRAGIRFKLGWGPPGWVWAWLCIHVVV